MCEFTNQLQHENIHATIVMSTLWSQTTVLTPAKNRKTLPFHIYIRHLLASYRFIVKNNSGSVINYDA